MVSPDSVVTVVRLSGELDMATEQSVAHAVDEALATTHEVVRLDLTALRFCDVRGLASLFEARERLQRAHRRLEVTGVPPCVRRMLAVTGLQDHLGLYP